MTENDSNSVSPSVGLSNYSSFETINLCFLIHNAGVRKL